jgi:hypothetical protein
MSDAKPSSDRQAAPVPCFCGREPRVSTDEDNSTAVECNHCEILAYEITRTDAIARWNALLEPVTRMREALEEIAECCCNCDGPKVLKDKSHYTGCFSEVTEIARKALEGK